MSNEILQTLRCLHNAIESINNPDVCEAWLRDADETLSALEVPVKRKLTPEERKSLSLGEIAAKWQLEDSLSVPARYECFEAGVRFAEKHHGIGKRDE